MKNLEIIGNQLLPVIAYGDACGLPFETRHADDIGPITGLRGMSTNKYLANYPRGTWSDDAHLSLTVMKSLVDAGGFNLQNQARYHVAAYDHMRGSTADPDMVPPVVSATESSGWGKSTLGSVMRLRAGVAPYESGHVDGAGNGVLMKLAPLVYWQRVAGGVSEQDLVDFSQMTHNSPEATVATLVHARVLGRLLIATELPEPLGFLDEIAAEARSIEHERGFTAVNSQYLEALGCLGRKQGLTPQTIKECAPKGGFYVPETLVMVYGSFAVSNIYPRCVYDAVELGGDTDSVASIIGTMSLFLHGDVKQPADYKQIYAHEHLERISKQFTEAALAQG